MLSVFERLAICHQCPFRANGCSGPCFCTVDEKHRDILHLSESNDCPRGYYHGTPPLKRIVHGAVGVAKYHLGLGSSTPSTINRRKLVCRICIHAIGDAQGCRLCGCNLNAKLALASEKCPQDRWGKSGGSIAVVQLGRFGDILIALPQMRRWAMDGQKIVHIVHKDAMELVEGLSYLTPLVYDGAVNDVAGAIQFAREKFPDTEIVATHVAGNPLRVSAPNYVLENWTRGGMVEHFDKLPLVLDNRNAIAEKQIHAELIGEDRRPLVLVNTGGYSSPYENGSTLIGWLNDRFGQSCRVQDLTDIRTPRLQDLLGLYDRATVLVTTDTATLHLSAANRLATVALVNDKPYFASERQRHWVERLTYSESLTDAGRDRIATAIENALAAQPGPRIVHVVDDYRQPDLKGQQRFADAEDTWQGIPGWRLARFRLAEHADRSSVDLGDSRKLPFIRDIFDFAASIADEGEIIVFTNSDICLTPEAPQMVRDAMKGRPCAWSRRMDVASAKKQLHVHELEYGSLCAGIDLFAFRADWWEHSRERCPDMLLGCEWWDSVMSQLMIQDNSDAEIEPAAVYHEQHDAFWCRRENLNNNPGQVHNRRLRMQWQKDTA